MKGRVFLIGAGPGDPGLLTVKGRTLLARADVVVYDALINPRILEWTSPGVRLIFAGKRSGRATLEQSAINSLLIQEARRGRQVVRLKGGDPFLFGRGGEEASALAEAGVPFEVVPGVTAASGASAYAGIPLTDRRLGSMVTLVTGHEPPGRNQAGVEWSRISRQSTVIVYMGVEQLPLIADRLLHLNWDARTPVAVIRWASLPMQTILEGTLGDIAAKAERAQLASPALIVIGRVVGLRKKLAWFEKKPLLGRRIVVTRAAEQAASFVRTLEDAGADVLTFSTIAIRPPRGWSAADAAIARLSSFDWILFTSVNGVAAFFERLRERGGDIRDLKGIRLGAIGPKTRARLAALGLRVDVFPEEYHAEAFVKALGAVKGQRFLLARAEEGRDVIPETLTAAGATVTLAPVYRTVKTRHMAPEIKALLLSGGADVVTFTSSSTVDGFMRHFRARERRQLFSRAKAAVIGPITAKTLRDYGVRPSIEAPRATIESLAGAILSAMRK